jgi:hypothetical protein
MKNSRKLSDLGSIGPAMLKDFELLKIHSVDQLAKQDPKRLYERLCKITGVRQDPLRSGYVLLCRRSSKRSQSTQGTKAVVLVESAKKEGKVMFAVRDRLKHFISLALIVICFLFPYCTRWHWKFESAVILILLLSYWKWRKGWMNRVGLDISPKDLALCTLLTILFYFLGRIFILDQAKSAGLNFIFYQDWRWRISPLFQVLNEEIVLRAVLLGYMIELFRHQLLASVFTALAFTFLHWVLYYF